MTAYKRGDVVPVGFVFSDESGKKLRPALVISSFELAVNLKTAKQLGLAIPQARLARADRVIQ
jgi:ABC-type uncharacterized transport system substrate-binding protein